MRQCQSIRAGSEPLFGLAAEQFFDTLHLDLGARAETVYRDALAAGYNLRRVAAGVLGISLDETTTRDDIGALFKVIAQTTLDIDAERLRAHLETLA